MQSGQPKQAQGPRLGALNCAAGEQDVQELAWNLANVSAEMVE